MFKIAFRNIFRNKKRTFFTLLSTIIGTAGIIFAMSYFDGLSDLIEKEAIKSTGHIRITSKDYEIKSRVFDTSSNIPTGKIGEIAKKNPEIANIKNIIKFGGFAFKEGKDTKVMGFGIDKENDLVKNLIKGRNFQENDNNKIIIGKKVLEKLNLSINDELTLAVSTQFFSTFALSYEIIGVIDEATMNRSVFLPIKEAQYLLDMEGKSSEGLIYLKDKKKIELVKKDLEKNLSLDEFRIEPYNKIGFASAMELYGVVKFIIAIIMGLLSSIAIFNTMVMSVFERKREIGVIKALGMEEKDIKNIIVLEGLIIGGIGSVFGVVTGSLTSLYFQIHGIYLGSSLDSISNSVNFGDTIYTKLTLEAVVTGLLIGIVTALFASYLPARKEVKKEIVDNLNNKKN